MQDFLQNYRYDHKKSRDLLTKIKTLSILSKFYNTLVKKLV